MSSNKKSAHYTELISYCVSPSHKQSLKALLCDGQKLSAYARSTIDPERIMEPYNDAKERKSAIILSSLSDEFDEAIFALRGALKKDYLANFHESSALEKIMLSSLKVSHFLVEVCGEFPVKNEQIKEEGEKLSEKISFKIPKELKDILDKKCVGDDSVSQVCRLMLCPYGVIIPSNTHVLKNIIKWSVFYSSRIHSITQQIEGRMEELNYSQNEAAKVAAISLLETLTDLQRLIAKALNVEPVDRNNKS